MDLLEEHYDDYLAWLYRRSDNIVKRDPSVLYYDCTNFYFECEQEDDDIVDEVTGEVMTGLRQYGLSKEHRPNPIVEMGLFMDSRGIPITMCLHPGNTSEQLTAIPLEKEVLKMIPNANLSIAQMRGLIPITSGSSTAWSEERLLSPNPSKTEQHTETISL